MASSRRVTSSSAPACTAAADDRASMRPKARRHQLLLQSVVEHVSQSAALPLLGAGQVGRQSPELGCLSLEGVG